VGSWQGEPGVEPEKLAVPFGGLVEGVDLCGRQRPVGPQVEAHLVRGDGAAHGRDELGVDQGHPDGGLAGAGHGAGGVEHPAGVLVAAVGLVEELQEVAGGLLWIGGGIGRGVPEGAPVVGERVEPVAELVRAGAYVGEGERGPVGKVAFGCGAVSGEVARASARSSRRGAGTRSAVRA
jgi:hypothetical protein